MIIKKYIDLILIDEYAQKDFNVGYYLETQSLPEYEKDTFLKVLWDHDPALRELVEDYMQARINERVEIKEQEDRYFEGYEPKVDHQTGETQWVAVNR